jgi:hypothetical protein
MTETTTSKTIVGEPEVVEDAVSVETLVKSGAWAALKAAVSVIRPLQAADGHITNSSDHVEAQILVDAMVQELPKFRAALPHDADYLDALILDLERWAAEGFGIPDFYDSLVAFRPERHRHNGLQHLVLFPMYTQNGSSERLLEAVLVEVLWPDFIATLEAEQYSNALFVPVRFLDFTEGYNTNSAVLFPETVSMRQIPTFTWGAIFAAGLCTRHPPSPGSTCPPTQPACSMTSGSPKRPSPCGTSFTTAPTCAATCRLTLL